jgi:hypothetical protein
MSPLFVLAAALLPHAVLEATAFPPCDPLMPATVPFAVE